MHGLVIPASLIWNGTGFVTVQSVITTAEAALAADGLTLSGDVNRAAQQA